MRKSFQSWAAAVALAAAAGWSTSALAQLPGGIPDVGGDAGGDVAGDVGGAVQDAADQAPDIPQQAPEVPQQTPEVPSQPQDVPAPQLPDAEVPAADDIPGTETDDLTDGAIQPGDQTVEDTQDAIDDTADQAQDAIDDTADQAQDAAGDAVDQAQDATDDATDFAEDATDDAADQAQDATDDATDFAQDATDEATDFAEGATEDAQAAAEEAMQSFDELDAEAQAEARANAEFSDEANEAIAADLGLDVQASAEGEEGITVNSVQEQSLAAQLGLQAGDRIVSVDGRSFNSYRGFNEYLWRHGYNRIPIVIFRNGQRQTVWWDYYPNRWNAYFIRPGFGYGYGHGYRGGYAQQQGPHGGLGVLVVDSGLREGGVFVQAVHRDSPAARAGVQPGDVILAMNGRTYRGATQFVEAIRRMEPNSRVQLAILRENGRQAQLTAQLTTRENALGSDYTQQQLAERDQGQRQTVLRPQYDGEGQPQAPRADSADQQRIQELEQQVRDLQQQLEEMNNQNQ